MSLDLKPYKGARDFYPEDMRLMKYIFGKWRAAAEKFGYEEYDAPILEPIEMYQAKTGQEIVSEQTYVFTDRGGRQVAMRPEMTPSVSRLVAARRQELAYPLRMFNIGRRFRYERPQKGRLREFWQFDVDLFGVENLNAEFEMIQMANSVLKSFGADESMYEIRVNSRVLLNQQIEQAKPKVELNEVVSLIDKYDKLSSEDFAAELARLVENPQVLQGFLNGGRMSDELDRLVKKCEKLGCEVKFVPSLARGFDYYTDIVFEVFDTNPDNRRSMFGGGRYDGLVGLFGVDPVPTIGFAMGDAMLAEFLKGWKLVPDLQPETDLYVALIGDVDASEVIAKLRENLNVAVDFSGHKLDKQIKSASRKGIKYLLAIGESELTSGKLTLKNLETGAQQQLSLREIASACKPT